MSTTLSEEQIYKLVKKNRAIIDEDAPPVDEHIIQACLKNLNVPLPIPVQFQYDPAINVDDRWAGFRAEVAAIPAIKHVPYWYPWIYKIPTHSEATKTVSFGVNNSPKEATISQLPEYQGVLRWRVWKQGKAHSDGFLEMFLEPDPKTSSQWRQRTSIHTFNSNLNIEILKQFLNIIRTKRRPGIKAAFKSREDFKIQYEEALKVVSESSYPRKPNSITIATQLGIDRNTLRYYLKQAEDITK